MGTGRLNRGRALALLGICLGAQLISRIMGGHVGPMKHGKKEIGFGPIEYTTEGASSPLALLGNVPVLHWHGDEFEIPKGAVRLAKTELCPNQAFSVDAMNYQRQEEQHVLLGLNKTIYKSKNRLSITKAVFTCFLYISLTYIHEIMDFGSDNTFPNVSFFPHFVLYINQIEYARSFS